MSRESLQPKIEAANNNAAFEVLAANEAAEVAEAAQVERMVASKAAEAIAELMDAATRVNLTESNADAGQEAFQAVQDAAAA